MDERILEIVLRARDEASDTIEGVGKKAGGVSEILGKSFKDAAIVSGAALAGLTAVAFTSVEAFNEHQKAVSQLDAVLKSTHGAAGLYKDDLLEQAEALQNLTTYDNDAILGAENLMLTFTNVKGAIYQQSIPAILDMSTALGQDLKSSSIQLGKALNDPIQGITALRRVGVSFSKDQQEVIKKLVETGKTAQAQQLILKEINNEFGGSAQAAANTFGGSLVQLKNQWGDLEKVGGEFIVKALQPLISNLVPILKTINDLAKGYATLGDLQKTLTQHLGVFGTAIGNIIVFFNKNHSALMLVAGALSGVLAISLLAAGIAIVSFIGMSLPVLAIFAAIGAGVALVATHWEELSPILAPVGVLIQSIATAFMQFVGDVSKQVAIFVKNNMGTFQAFWTILVALFNFALGFISGYWNTVWKSMADLLYSIWEIIKGVVEIGWGVVSVILNIGMGILTGNWSKAWEGIKTGLGYVWDGIKNIIKGGVDNLIGTIRTALDAVIGLVNGVISGFNAVSSKVPGFKGVKIPELPHFQDGGWVPQTGLAVVHQGEFVLSNAMLQGRQAIPQSVNTKSFNQPITINASIANGMDINELGYRLAFVLRNSR